MAFTVVANLSDVDLAESATPWTTGALDPDKFVQGSNSIGWYAAKNGRQVNGVSSKSINWATGDHLYFWAACDVASKLEAQSTGTTTASGLTVLVTLANGATREWHVAGSDTWDGGWRCFVVDLGHTGTHLYASSGTWTDLSNITDVDFYYDLTNSGNIRNVPANTYQDAIRVGTGLTAYNTSAADASFDFADIAAVAEATAQAYGVTETKDGVIFLQGVLTLGATATNHLDFDSQDEIVVFSLRDGTDGFGLVADALYRIDVVANSTGTDQDFSMGVKVGTGDTANGRNGTQLLAGAAGVRWQFDASDIDLHSCTVYGSTFRGAYLTTTTTGVQFSSALTTHEIAGCTFDGCSQVDTGDAAVRNCNFLNSTSSSTEGALYWDPTDIDAKNCLFVNNTNAIEVRTLSADMTITGFSFSGNTNDIRYEGASDYDCNVISSDTPTINNAGAGTLTAVSNPVTLNVTAQDAGGTKIQNARCFVLAGNTVGGLPYQDSVTIARSGAVATVTHTAHGFSVGQKVYITGTGDATYFGSKTIATVPGVNSYTYAVTGTPANPTSCEATAVIIDELTTVAGLADDTRTYAVDQLIDSSRSWLRKGSSADNPKYKTAPIAGTIDAGAGLSLTVQMIEDE